MLSEMLSDLVVSRTAVRYIIDKVAPFAHSTLTGGSEAMEEYKIDKSLAELRGYLAMPEIPTSLSSRLQFLADNCIGYANTVGLRLDEPRSIRAFVYLFVPLEEQADFVAWEIERILEDNQFNPIPELGQLDTIQKNLMMNLHIYMDIKSMALSGGDVSQEEILSFEKAIVDLMAHARQLTKNFD